MARLVILLGTLFLTISTFGQNRKDWTQLDFLNKASEDPFMTENDISGQCFIRLSDNFDYYKTPIIIRSTDKMEILRIEFSDSLGTTTTVTTTFKGQSYKQFDNQNPFNPWLFSDNSDYFRLAFECVDSTGTQYKVKINDEEVVSISKDNTDFKKQEITDFVIDWTSLGFDFDRSANPLRESPNGKIIIHADQKEYKIWTGESLEVKGDWIKVKTLKNEVGWVKWRSGNKVLIRMYFAC